MKIFKTYKFRLKPTKEQAALLRQQGGISRFVWNKLLNYCQETQKTTTKLPTQSQLLKYIISLKQTYPFIKLAHSQPVQINVINLGKAYSKAFKPETLALRKKKICQANQEISEEKRNKQIAKALNFGFPKFKSKKQHNDNLFYPQNFKIRKSRIFFSKLGWINYIKHREILGVPLFTTIVQDGLDYYIAITCKLNIKEKIKPLLDQSNIVGIDVGLTKFVTLSDGSSINNPRTLSKNINKLSKESKKLSNKVYTKEDHKGSQNWNKQVNKVQKINRKVRNIRKDFLHKTTHHIISKYDGVVLENLDIQEMLSKNSKVMNRNTSDVSWYEFGRQLEYKSIWNSKYFCKIDRYFPSTQLCSQCGNKMSLSIKERTYICSACGVELGRDANASINIKNEGIRVLKENTVATTGIKVCGLTTLVVGKKQKKIVDNSAMANEFAIAV